MRPGAQSLRHAFALASLIAVASCGGGGGTSVSSGGGGGGGGSGSNMVPLVVDTGPAASTSSSVNQAFVTITVCPAGSTSNCQTIDHVWVDTGSSGLRLMASALTAPLALSNPGTPVANCAQFVSNSTWGAVRLADVTIGSMTAMAVPIQVIADAAVPPMPPGTCSSSGAQISTVSQLGANGLLGVGLFKYDCGPACTPGNAPPPGWYYTCPGGTCTPTTVALTGQLQNIASLFNTNGVLIQLPALSSATGQATATGTLSFGFTSLASGAMIFPTDNQGFIGTTFGGTSNVSSFVDSGSNGWFFDDSTLVRCTTAGLVGFYCSSKNETATMSGVAGTPSFTYSFRIADAGTLNGNFAAFDNLGGPSGGNFDWGLPFFYGRSVYTVIEGNAVGGSTGPFIAATTP